MSQYNLSIFQKLDKAHDNIINQSRYSEAKVSVDKNIADKMQNLLLDFKSRSGKSSPKYIDQQFDEEAKQEIFDLARKAMGKGRSWQKLFSHSHGSTLTRFGGDDIAEEELSAIISAIEAKISGQNINVSKHLVGSELVSIDQNISSAIQEQGNNLVNSLTDNSDAGLVQKKRVGKVDVTGTTTTLHIQAGINPSIIEMFKLFQGKSFSVKNYKSVSWDKIEKTRKQGGSTLKLGSSKLEKSLGGPLMKYAHWSAEEINELIRSLSPQTPTNILTHIYHLRFMYELEGTGQINEELKEATEVDFLVYNDPMSDNIYVRSTAELIRKEITAENVSRNGLINSIEISKKPYQNLDKPKK